MFFVAVGLAVALSLSIVWLGRLVGAPFRTALLSLIVAAGAGFGALALEATGWRDTDGWIDCSDYCHGWHYVGMFLFWTPTLTGLFLLVGITVGLLARASRQLRKRDGK